MRQLATIVSLGTVVFIAVAMAQEWEVFSPWLGIQRRSPEQRSPSPELERQAGETVRAFLDRLGDFYRSGGDRSVAAALPASPEVVEDLARDVDFLGRQGKREELRLLQLEILSTKVGPEDFAELSTRERWEVRILDARGGAVAPTAEQVLHCSYQLARAGAEWNVRAWRHEG